MPVTTRKRHFVSAVHRCRQPPAQLAVAKTCSASAQPLLCDFLPDVFSLRPSVSSRRTPGHYFCFIFVTSMLLSNPSCSCAFSSFSISTSCPTSSSSLPVATTRAVIAHYYCAAILSFCSTRTRLYSLWIFFSFVSMSDSRCLYMPMVSRCSHSVLSNARSFTSIPST